MAVLRAVRYAVATSSPQGGRGSGKILWESRPRDDLEASLTMLLQVPFTLFLPEDLFFGPKERSRIIVHKPVRPGDPEFKDVATLRKHCFDTITVRRFSLGWSWMLVYSSSIACAAAARSNRGPQDQRKASLTCEPYGLIGASQAQYLNVSCCIAQAMVQRVKRIHRRHGGMGGYTPSESFSRGYTARIVLRTHGVSDRPAEGRVSVGSRR